MRAARGAWERRAAANCPGAGVTQSRQPVTTSFSLLSKCQITKHICYHTTLRGHKREPAGGEIGSTIFPLHTISVFTPLPALGRGRVLGGDLASAAMWVSRAGRLLSHPYLRVSAGLVLAAGRGEAVAGVRGDVDGGAQAPAAGQGAGHPVVGALVGALVTPVTPGHLGPGPLVAPPVLPLAAGGTPTRAVASADGHGAALGVTADK